MGEKSIATFGGCRYLGGISKYGKAKSLNDEILFFKQTHLGLGTFSTRFAKISYDEIVSLEIDSDLVSKSKVLPVLAFGVLGLGAKGVRNQVALTVNLLDGGAAYFSIGNTTVTKVKAGLAPVLRATNLEYSDVLRDEERASSLGPGGMVQFIRDLATLRDEGLLTQEEFDAQKARALAGMGSDLGEVLPNVDQGDASKLLAEDEPYGDPW